LRRHRDQWFAVVREHPEKLLSASTVATESGPLEALLAELAFNRWLVTGPPDSDYPPLEVAQFRRAIAANALAVLAPSAEESVSHAYRAVKRINQFFEQLLHLAPGERGYGSAVTVRNDLRDALRDRLIPNALRELERALGKTPQGVS
jgi:hypothetical protein